MINESESLKLGEHVFTAHDLVAILDGVSDGITVQDAAGNLIYVNPAAAAASGFDSPEEMINTPSDQRMAGFAIFDEGGNPLPVNKLPSRRVLDKHVKDERVIRFTARKTGEERWALIRARPAFDENGELRYVVNIVHDITDHVAKQEELEQNATQLEEITTELETTVDELKEKTEEADAARQRAEYIADRQAFLAEAGRMLASTLDVEATLRMIVHLAVPRIADWATISLLDDKGQPRQLEVAHADPDKLRYALELQKRYPPDPADTMRMVETGKSELYAEIPEELIARTARDETHLAILRRLNLRSAMVVPLKIRDTVLGVLTFVAAESGRRYGADDLEFAESLAARSSLAITNSRLYREAQEANRSKSDFLAVMSHELRTPLTAIFGYTELLATGVTGPVSDEQVTQLERIRASASHLLGIIEEILAYARSEAGQDQVMVDAFLMSDVVSEAVALVAPAARNKSLGLTQKIESDCQLWTDGVKLRQILVNLLGNAVKFTAAGRVDITASCPNGNAIFRISDTGPGIPAADQGRIFEPFRQLQSATTRSVGGTGLGLAVTKRFVQLLGGTLELQSEVGKGTTFTVSVPVNSPA